MGSRTLGDTAKYVRSKNAGPFRITFDIVFADLETYTRFRDAAVVTPESFAILYGISPSDITDFVYFEPGRALKVTVQRPVPAGSVEDCDVYGAQQHVPLLSIAVPF